MRKKVLGRGLGALIPEAEPLDAAPRELDIDLVTTNPEQPRFHIDEKALEELAASIRENGILQPILVRPMGPKYQLIAGERRLLAAQRAGLLKVPAVVRQVPDRHMLLLALIENLQREQLNPIEEAQAYHKLMDLLQTTQEEVAGHLGRERSTVANAVRLLRLPAPVKKLVAEGRLSPGHARALLSAGAGPAEMEKAARTMVDEAWSVRDAERWAKGKTKRRRTSPTARDPNLDAAEERLRRLYGTKVEIALRGRARAAGSIRIHFYNAEDLQRIFSMLTEKSQ
ncbi:MAG: ParB/RepB/Spo0J family partition protein [Acidobacteriota bacterium]